MKNKNENQVDERIKIEKNKIWSEACIFMMVALLVSIFVKQRFYSAPISQYAVELIILIIAALYIVFRYMFAGHINSAENPFITNLIRSLIFSAGATFSFVVRMIQGEGSEFGIVNNIVSSVLIFIIFTLITLGILLLFSAVNKKRQRQIEKNMDEENEL
jgi:FlaA1/EpsC-like NDP-sugar epimerase